MVTDLPWEFVRFPVRDLCTGGVSVEMETPSKQWWRVGKSLSGLDSSLVGGIPFEIKSAEIITTFDRGSVGGVRIHSVDLDDQAYGLMHTSQLILPLAGGFDLLLSDGVSWRDFNVTDNPGSDVVRGVLIKPGVWREFRAFAPGTVMVIFSDGVPENVPPDGTGKILDWAEFMDMIGKSGREKGYGVQA